VLNGIVSLEDMVPTLMAAAGVPDIKERLLTGHQAGEKHFRVHLDGFNQLPYLTGEVDESPRHEFFYYGEHDLVAMRYNNWKVHFQVKDDWFAGALLRPTIPRPVTFGLTRSSNTWTRPLTRSSRRPQGLANRSASLDDRGTPMVAETTKAASRPAPTPDMVWIPAGTFMMGSDSQLRPALRTIRIPRRVMKGGSQPLRAKLLPSISASSTQAPSRRHSDIPPLVPLHQPRLKNKRLATPMRAKS
jgi:hypothetical protein